MLHKESSDTGQENAQKTAWIKSIKFNRKHTKKDRRSKGFSLIELLVTVGIIGILASVAIPAYNKYRQNAAKGAAEAEAQNMRKAFEACLAGGQKMTVCATGHIANVLPATCSAVIGGGIAAEGDAGCHWSTVTATHANTCYDSVKVTGGFVASFCASYDVSDGQWTIIKGGATSGAGYNLGDSRTAGEKGLCKAAGICD